jgi:hypothetical protein
MRIVSGGRKCRDVAHATIGRRASATTVARRLLPRRKFKKCLTSISRRVRGLTEIEYAVEVAAQEFVVGMEGGHTAKSVNVEYLNRVAKRIERLSRYK